MKPLINGILCLLIILSCISSDAQNISVREPNYKRPILFQNFPQRTSIDMTNLEYLLQYETGRQVSLTLAPNFIFQGIVSSVVSKNENSINSIVIRSTNWHGAAFSFSKINKPDGSFYFTGRIISFEHGDGYELNYENGQYYLNKKGFYDMVNE